MNWPLAFLRGASIFCTMLVRLLIILCLSFAPLPALAQESTVRDRVLSILRDDGFREVRISRTLLGRMRFVAENRDERREIIVNPATGVILRDYVRFLSDDSGSAGPTFGGGGDDDEDPSGFGSGDDDDDDGGSDDRGSDDDDDDGGSDDDDGSDDDGGSDDDDDD